MSNSFYISVSPELAALETKIDIIDTVVDTIRATDVPNIQTNIDANETKIDLIRGTDVPNIQTNIDANETKIDTIDGIVDAIKTKTDATPQKIRGNLSFPYAQTTFDVLLDVCNITGQGKLNYINISTSNVASTVELTIIIDGVTGTLVTHTGDNLIMRVFPMDSDYSGSSFTFGKTVLTTSDANLINLEFDTSLHIQLRRSAGPVANVYAICCVNTDSL